MNNLQIFLLQSKQRLYDNGFLLSVMIAGVILFYSVILVNINEVGKEALLIPTLLLAVILLIIFQNSMMKFILNCLCLLVTVLMISNVSKYSFLFDNTGRLTAIWTGLLLASIFIVFALNGFLKNTINPFVISMISIVSQIGIFVGIIYLITENFSTSKNASVINDYTIISIYSSFILINILVFISIFMSRYAFKYSFSSKKVFYKDFIKATKNKDNSSLEELNKNSFDCMIRTAEDTGLSLKKYKSSGKENGILYIDNVNFVIMPTQMKEFKVRKDRKDSVYAIDYVPPIRNNKMQKIVYSYLNSYSGRKTFSSLPLFFILLVEDNTINKKYHALNITQEKMTVFIVEKSKLSIFIDELIDNKLDIKIVARNSNKKDILERENIEMITLVD